MGANVLAHISKQLNLVPHCAPWSSHVFPTGLWGKGRRERVGLEGTSGEQQQEAQSKELKEAEYEHRELKIGKKLSN